LLALSRLQAGSATPRSDWVSIEDLISAAADSARGRRPRLRVTVGQDVPEVRADAAQLERAFANLLENAGRYGGDEQIDVTARRDHGSVLVTVTDHGGGIELAEQARIFEPFYRGRDASRAWAGSGLGLAIVKGFVEANGGSITVRSRPGEGTSFIISLPLPERNRASEPAATDRGTAGVAP
ncbi:MAG: sensor histidine kinase, partial [Solirubrobacteraceae bacterium]